MGITILLTGIMILQIWRGIQILAIPDLFSPGAFRQREPVDRSERGRVSPASVHQFQSSLATAGFFRVGVRASARGERTAHAPSGGGRPERGYSACP